MRTRHGTHLVSDQSVAYINMHWANSLTLITYNSTNLSNYGLYDKTQVFSVPAKNRTTTQWVREAVERMPVGPDQILGVTSEETVGSKTRHHFFADIDSQKSERLRHLSPGDPQLNQIAKWVHHLAKMVGPIATFQSSPGNYHLIGECRNLYKTCLYGLTYLNVEGAVDPGYLYFMEQRHYDVLRISEKNGNVPMLCPVSMLGVAHSKADETGEIVKRAAKHIRGHKKAPVKDTADWDF